jgi:hypothetical protein
VYSGTLPNLTKTRVVAGTALAPLPLPTPMRFPVCRMLTVTTCKVAPVWNCDLRAISISQVKDVRSYFVAKGGWCTWWAAAAPPQRASSWASRPMPSWHRWRRRGHPGRCVETRRGRLRIQLRHSRRLALISARPKFGAPREIEIEREIVTRSSPPLLEAAAMQAALHTRMAALHSVVRCRRRR